MIPDNWNFLANLLGTPEPAEPPAKPEDDAKQEQSAAAESTSPAAQPAGQADALDEADALDASDLQPTGETDSSEPGDSATVAEEVLTALTSVTPPPSLPGFGVRDADPKLDELAASPASADLPRKRRRSWKLIPAKTPIKLPMRTTMPIRSPLSTMLLGWNWPVNWVLIPSRHLRNLVVRPCRRSLVVQRLLRPNVPVGRVPRRKRRARFRYRLGIGFGTRARPEPEIDLTSEAAAEQSSSAATGDSGRDEGRSGRWSAERS